jgi:hypothetical protein
VAFQDFEEVWAALGRLYSDIVKLQESQQQLTAQLAPVGEQIARLIESQGRLVEARIEWSPVFPPLLER